MKAAGIIFSNIHDSNIRELTAMRTVASIPFGCRYRLIDFPLSNMVNARISNIGVITHYNYHSLMEHIGSGKDWDLARRSGGVKILPPYITAYANNVNYLYRTRLEALMSVRHSIRQIREEYVVLSDCDVVCNIDMTAILERHVATKADITIAVRKCEDNEAWSKNVYYMCDKESTITDMLSYPSYKAVGAYASMNIMIMRSDYLRELLQDSVAHGYSSMSREVIARKLPYGRVKAYIFDGRSIAVQSFADYFAGNMSLVRDIELRRALFSVASRPIFTRVRNSPPSYYSESASASSSLIADGCTIIGQVESSVLFRGVKIGRGAIVRNCVLLQGTIVGEGCRIENVVSDKNGAILDGRILIGSPTQPYYVARNTVI